MAEGGVRAALHNLRPRSRLAIAVIVGALAYALASAGLGLALRAMLAWLVGVVAFLALTALVVADSSPERVRARARALDQSSTVIFVLIIVAAAASLGALGFVLQKPDGATAPRVLVATLAVAAAWLMVHTMFALHYAHFYYGDDPDREGDDERGGLLFPGHAPPDYWDFFYYAFVVGMTCQVSDVQVTTRGMRRLTLAHGVLSFFFNTGVLALAVNIIASAL
jgi:uncharacterized membrane protein